MSWFDKLLQILEKYLPAFLVGYKVGQSGKDELVKENTNLKLDVKAAQDANNIENHNATLSDDELRNEMLGRRGGGTDG